MLYYKRTSFFPRAMLVKLNVGGQLFITTEETLQNRPSMLNVLVRHDNPAQLVDGAFFIDRDPQAFRWILNYLRGSSVLPPKHSTELLRLQEEAQYFAVDGLVQHIRHLICPSFSKDDHVRVRDHKFTVTGVEDTGYLVTRGGKRFRIPASDSLEATDIEVGDVVMAYRIGSHRHMAGVCMNRSGHDTRIQFNGDLCTTQCKLSGIRF